MSEFERELEERLTAIRDQGLYRQLRRVDSAQGPGIELAGRKLINFSSNDYLGLANHPGLKEAAMKAVDEFGAGSGASRLICGSLAPHHELEDALAAFKGAEAALSFSSGYGTAIGTICALLGKEDIVIVDKLVHACIVDAARLCGAKIRIFAHNDLNDLENILKWTDSRNESAKSHPQCGASGIRMARPAGQQSRALIVTESIFSMDGDHAPLREIVALKEEYGAWLMVDEAHATGIYGERRRGLADQLGVADHIDIHMGTLGKALGASGGFICGSRALIDFLINRARSFIFSTAPVPAAAAAAKAGVQFIQSREGEERQRKVWSLAGLLKNSAIAAGIDVIAPGSLIMPIIVGDEAKAVAIATALRAKGIFVPAIRYPTVARGAARLRVTLTASHSVDDVVTLVQALGEIADRKL